MSLTQISTNGIKDANVNTADIADNAVTTAKIATDAVTQAKIAASAIHTENINDNAVTTAKITDANITTAKIQDDAVVTSKIAAGAVTTARLADQAVTLAKLEHGTSSNNGKFLRANNGADPTFETVNTDLVSDTTPQLGGNLNTNGNRIDFGDNDKATFGTGSDLQIYHNGTHSYIQDAGTGNLKLVASVFQVRNAADNETMIEAHDNGQVELYHNDTKVLNTANGGVEITGNLNIPDGDSGTNTNGGLRIGNSGDLHIYHDGNNSHIKETGTGDLFITAKNNIYFYDYGTNETMAKMVSEGAVELYHDNSKKFETTSAGVAVTGDYIGDNDWIKTSKLTSYDTTKSPIQQSSKTYWYTRLDDSNSIQSSQFRNLAGSGGNSNSFQSTIIPVGNMTRQSDAGSFSAYHSSTNTQAVRTNLANADDFNIATKGLSMGCLVRLENTGSNGSGVIFYGDGNTENHFFSRYKYNGQGLMIGEDTDGSDNWTGAYPTSFFNDGDWRFVVMAVATNGTLLVSINGDRLTPVRLRGTVPTPSDAHFGIQGDLYNDNAARHRFATFWWHEGVISDALVAQEYAWMKTIWTSAAGLT